MAKIIPLTKNKYTLIDDDQSLPDGKWCYSTTGYAVKRINYELVWMHRLIANARPGEIVDHINGNKLDNRKSNLRICNAKENARNSKKKRNGNTSKFKGVCLTKNGKKFRATIKCDWRQYSLGEFDNEEDAAKAYNKAAIEMHGEFAKLNILGDESI